MKNIVLVLLTLIGVIIIQDVSAQRSKKQKLESEIDSVSYAIGVSFASSVKNQNISDLNLEKIYMAIDDILKNDQEPEISIKQSQKIITEYFTSLKEKLKKENDEKMTSFLLENKKNPEVVVLPSGLQYIVIEEGAGQSPLPQNKVKTHYKGTLLDGTVFDSSYEKGEPITFGITYVIKGWQEALVLMKPGAKWKLFVPPYLGYGDRETASIPANSLLIFEIELIGIE
jgi:FKBP-type peptidyl-prolyl cis-trans isomerase FklB